MLNYESRMIHAKKRFSKPKLQNKKIKSKHHLNTNAIIKSYTQHLHYTHIII